MGHDEAQLNYKAHRSVSLISEGSRIRHPTDLPRVGRDDQAFRGTNEKVVSPGEATPRLLSECGRPAYAGVATKPVQETGSHTGVPMTEPVPACLDVLGARVQGAIVCKDGGEPAFSQLGSPSKRITSCGGERWLNGTVEKHNGSCVKV